MCVYESVYVCACVSVCACVNVCMSVYVHAYSPSLQHPGCAQTVSVLLLTECNLLQLQVHADVNSSVVCIDFTFAFHSPIKRRVQIVRRIKGLPELVLQQASAACTCVRERDTCAKSCDPLPVYRC